jgi:WD40 repeat protein
MDAVQLEQCRRQLQSQVPLLGPWLRRRAVTALADDGSADAVQTLAGIVWRGEDVDTRAAALDALRDLAAVGNVAAQEALCRYAINHDDIPVRMEVLAAGYLPREESQRALFYFLTEQWTAYEALDYDHRLLRAVYEAAGEPLRRRIAVVARDAGRLEWVGVAAGGRQGRRLAAMTDAEWKAALSVLNEHERWDELWRLAQDAPPSRSASMLRRLRFVGWSPPPPETQDYEELVRLAEAWPHDDFRLALDCAAVLREHTDVVRCLALHPQGSMLASGSADRTVRLWQLPDGKLLQTLKGHKGDVTGVAISPDGRVLASAGRDRAVWLWRLPATQKAVRLKGHTQPILCMAITPDSRILATGGADSAIQLWELPNGKSLRMLGDHARSVLALAVAPDGRTLASASADGTARLWSLPDGKVIRSLRGHRDGDLDAVQCLAISPDGEILATGGTDGNICLWKLPGGSLFNTLEGHLAAVTAVAFSPEGDWLASGAADQTIRVWRLPDGRSLAVWEAHSSDVTHLAAGAEGRWLASASGNGLGYDHSIRLWNISECCWSKSLFGHDRYITALAVSPDGHSLVSAAGDGAIRLWTSPLSRLSNLPVRHASLKDLEWAQRVSHQDGCTQSEKDAARFVAALLRRRYRHDVEIDRAAPKHIAAGEFDIEIER